MPEHRRASVLAGFAADTAADNKITNLFTVGPRLGYAWDRWMIYATGGYATGRSQGQYCSTTHRPLRSGGSDLPSGASRNDGWFAGGGFEYMVHKGALVDVILGAEYQHFDVRLRAGVLRHSGLRRSEPATSIWARTATSCAPA